MKKALLAMLAVFFAFICVVLGMMLGRRSTGNHITISDDGISSATVGMAIENIETNASQQTGKININTATVSQLQILPNIGETLAQRIVDYRTQHGDFTSIDDLAQVEGIGDKRIEQIRQFVTVGG